MILKKRRETEIILDKDFFTKRETDVVCLLIKGKTTTQISKELGLKANTVSTIKVRIFYKLNIESDFDFYKLVFINNLCVS